MKRIEFIKSLIGLIFAPALFIIKPKYSPEKMRYITKKLPNSMYTQETIKILENAAIEIAERVFYIDRNKVEFIHDTSLDYYNKFQIVLVVPKGTRMRKWPKCWPNGEKRNLNKIAI